MSSSSKLGHFAIILGYFWRLQPERRKIDVVYTTETLIATHQNSHTAVTQRLRYDHSSYSILLVQL